MDDMLRRGILLGIGFVGGLGGVLSITPPQFGSSSLAPLGNLGTLPTNPAVTPSQVPLATPTPVASSSASQTPVASPSSVPTQSTSPTVASTTTKKTVTKKKVPVKTKTARPTAKPTPKTTPKPTPSSTPVSTPTPTPTQATGISGTFSGNVIQVGYGPVQVQITVSNNKIVSAKALQYPTQASRSQYISQQAIPYLVQETLQAQSANIQGVSGASYTASGWQQSLQSAIAKAGI